MFVLISITKPLILTSARFVFDGWKKMAIGADEKEAFWKNGDNQNLIVGC